MRATQFRVLTAEPRALAAVRSKSAVLLLLIYCCMYLPVCEGVLCWSLFL